MHEEKKKDNLRWVSHNDIKIRIRNLDKDTSVLWISKNGLDLGFSLIVHNFLEHCSESDLNIEIDSSWHQWKGLKAKKSEVDFLIGEVIFFIEEWGCEVSNSEDRLSEEEWYSI